MAHTKAGGSVKNNRDSKSKRLGVKKFGSQAVIAGEILVRQRGTKFHPGVNVKRVGDDSLISLKAGTLEFKKRKVTAFNGNLKSRTFINVIVEETVKHIKTAAKVTDEKIKTTPKANATAKPAAVKKEKVSK
jgi:large subunit ribosomal protein L27